MTQMTETRVYRVATLLQQLTAGVFPSNTITKDAMTGQILQQKMFRTPWEQNHFLVINKWICVTARCNLPIPSAVSAHSLKKSLPCEFPEQNGLSAASARQHLTSSHFSEQTSSVLLHKLLFADERHQANLVLRTEPNSQQEKYKTKQKQACSGIKKRVIVTFPRCCCGTFVLGKASRGTRP